MKYWYRKNLSEDHSDAPREFPELRERFARLGINPNDYQVQTAEGKTTWAPAEDQWIPMRVAIRYDPLAKVPLESLRAIGHYQSTRSHVNAFAFILPLLL